MLDWGENKSIKKPSIEPYNMSSQQKKDEADALKGKGNAAFQGKEYQKAIEYYTKAIEVFPSGEVYFSNRSAAQLAAGFPAKAEEDAQQCLNLAPQWTKAYIRLGDALRHQEKFQEALDTYREGKAVLSLHGIGHTTTNLH